jgi:phosphoglycerate dehydrogenase-like enzyme
MVQAVLDGGARVVPAAEAEALLWTHPDDPAGLADVLAQNGDRLRWIQLPWAGIEPYVPVLDHDRIWTCGKGVYAEPVAELALMLALAGFRGLPTYLHDAPLLARGELGRNLHGAQVVVVGAGGITDSFLRMVAPFRSTTTVVRRRDEPHPDADRTVTLEQIDTVLPGADVVVVACALTPTTNGMFDARRLALMAPHAWLINVARGAHVVTDDLLEALRTGSIGGAGLDVTDPEPLPADHPLWAETNCVITPHVGNTPAMARPLLSERIRINVARWIAGEPLLGPVDVGAGY